MKKFIALLLTFALAAAMTACGGSKSQSTAQSSPTPTPVSDPQVVEGVEIAIEAALDYVNDNDDISGAAKFSNAILENTTFQVTYADKNSCEIKFEYPEAEAFLAKAAEMLDDSATEEEMDAVLAKLAKEMENDDIRLIDRVTAEVTTNGDGSYTVVWNEDLYNAVSGGLYYAEEGK